VRKAFNTELPLTMVKSLTDEPLKDVTAQFQIHEAVLVQAQRRAFVLTGLSDSSTTI
jgi:hypothetical protein